MRAHVSVLSGLSIARVLTVRLLLLFGISVIAYFAARSLLFAQSGEGRAEYDTIQARENFRLGVNAFNYGYYNRAIVALEHSLALRPENPDAVFWLGRSYYSSGYVWLGLEQWKTLIDRNEAKASLKSFYETLDYRYRQASQLNAPDQYSLFMKLEPSRRRAYFVGPTAARTSPDRDEIYIVDYRDSKVVTLDTNGAVKSLLRGSLTQVYDHPFDILLRPKGQGFILSQEGTNSLLFCDERGYPYKEVGSKGNGPENFLGPQHLTDSGDGYFYVTDWGNRRIVKMDYDGNFIFTFGAAQGRFPGLKGPTGLVVRENKVYVSDTLQQRIFVFDQEGGYLETFPNSELSSPESLLVTLEGNLLIADGNRIKLYDFDRNVLKTIYTGDKKQKYIDLNYDRNLNIFAVDFSNKEIDFITPINKLYTDLFVQIDRVITRKYPKISVDVLVEDREGTPIVGLGRKNFQIMENNKAQLVDLIYTGVGDPSIALAIILGSKIEGYRDAIEEITGKVLPSDSFLLVQGGKDPRVLTNFTRDVDDKLSNYREPEGGDSPEANFDISLRFTLDSMVQFRQKKIIVFVSGDTDKIAAETYNISDLKSYLKLQNSNMYGILSEDNKIVSYLVNNTNGKLYTNANVRNFGQDIKENRKALAGYYTLNYDSTVYTDLARRYIPVEVSVRYVRRSGKDELGFFAPLSSINGTR
ncbi:hypothetical protein P0082_07415 [Candidatus Haliotispira prima]|uniref:NHL repeat containing protein n=1 Tax=Candidatus Haliotispira prima TaxID=3034016 RepID=A0ABY8MEA3_9SPIO|nr:hypothetical protein P0082_07415 [Candidatus Haliotispira prima]